MFCAAVSMFATSKKRKTENGKRKTFLTESLFRDHSRHRNAMCQECAVWQLRPSGRLHRSRAPTP